MKQNVLINIGLILMTVGYFFTIYNALNIIPMLVPIILLFIIGIGCVELGIRKPIN